MYNIWVYSEKLVYLVILYYSFVPKQSSTIHLKEIKEPFCFKKFTWASVTLRGLFLNVFIYRASVAQLSFKWPRDVVISREHADVFLKTEQIRSRTVREETRWISPSRITTRAAWRRSRAPVKGENHTRPLLPKINRSVMLLTNLLRCEETRNETMCLERNETSFPLKRHVPANTEFYI